MIQIDERLFRWLYGRYPKVGTAYYAVRQPILIMAWVSIELLLAVPFGIVYGIVEALVASWNNLLEAVSLAAFRFRRYANTLKGLWGVATIKTKGGDK